MTLDHRIQRLREVFAGRFHVESLLGKGGFASVYKVRNLALDRWEALKVMADDHTDDRDFALRFAQEARVAASLDHPNILKIYDFGTTGGIYWYSMTCIEGPTLRSRVDSGGPLTPRAAAEFSVPLLDALAYSHARGVIHRDVKPDNVILDGGKTPYLMDFGIAKSEAGHLKTQTGAVLGTPAYVAPEQAQGKPLDGRADLYAFGIMLYRLTAGAFPFDGQDPLQLVLKRLTEEPTPLSEKIPGVAPVFEQIVMTALARQREGRWANAGDMRDALRGFIRGEGDVRPITFSFPAATEAGDAPPTAETRFAVPAATGRTVVAGAGGAPDPQAAAPTSPSKVASLPRGVPRPLLVGAGIGVLAIVLAAIALVPRLRAPSAPAASRGPEPAAPATASVPVPTASALVPTPGPAPVPTAVPTAEPAPEPTREPAPPRPAPTRAPTRERGESHPRGEDVRPAAPPAGVVPGGKAPVLLENTEPELPSDLKSACSGRTVGVSVTIGTDGTVKRASVMNRKVDVECHVAAEEAARKLRYQPATDGAGNPIEKVLAVAITFP